LKTKSIGIMICATLFSWAVAQVPQNSPAAESPQASSHPLPAFEVSTINTASGKLLGFYGHPGGRIELDGETLKLLIAYAYDVQDFQITGGPEWASNDRYDILAIPPENSPSRATGGAPSRANPTQEERDMIKSLLFERFGLKLHSEMKTGPVYFLIKSGKPLQLAEAKDKLKDPRGGVFIRTSGVADGEALGINLSMPAFARSLSENLECVVIDQTNLQGGYDFHVHPNDPTNRDVTEAVLTVVDRMGLKLKPGKAPIQYLVIDAATPPSQN
jgi:uncharacterized protein (TIGR03435 family)